MSLGRMPLSLDFKRENRNAAYYGHRGTLHVGDYWSLEVAPNLKSHLLEIIPIFSIFVTTRRSMWSSEFYFALYQTPDLLNFTPYLIVFLLHTHFLSRPSWVWLELILFTLKLKPKQNRWILRGIFFFLLFRASPMAYTSSQARDLIRGAAAWLYHSQSNSRSEPHLQPTPQLTATPDP